VDRLKIRFRSGEREFEAEGEKDTVRAHWEEARAWLFKEETNEKGRSALPPPREEKPLPNTLFDVDPGRGAVRLRVLPPGGPGGERLSKALLLLLHGYRDLLAQNEVPAIRLAEDLRVSGFAGVRRLSRAFATLEQKGLAIRAGAGKGSRYRATNPGLAEAQSILNTLAS
jgi:hypothetical protein